MKLAITRHSAIERDHPTGEIGTKTDEYSEICPDMAFYQNTLVHLYYGGGHG